MSVRVSVRERRPRGIPLRAVVPNAITALALCSGLSGVRFAIAGEWERAVAMIVLAGVLDGLDGRVARMLKGESRFGAELDSLADAISFGVSPALVLYLWSLTTFPQLGWIAALMLAVFCALRLARFNAQIEANDQPRKAAGYFTGVPAPAGAGLAMLPLIAWLWSGEPILRNHWLVAPWVALVATLMVSSLATYSWKSFRLRRHMRFEAIAGAVVLAAALVTAPWQTLTVVSVLYLLAIPFSMAGYARIRRQRAAEMTPRPSEPTPTA
ncbi:CDP-diacylglycerol--serine O-phosphatidyltransferase [Sphingomonas sp.]|uniref:CDP-diacylglycerol--serine O-phosphatidyltransferase n=1 Tax=Sphingomonas sp. TaxID=28214 RepID=UPI002D7F4D3C|nr:CDP-diacylglycerol--serine O-phosphatidyltransferase [Sphingomonas sp.]HEU0044779.1 CDP-diacylglycerol--serine O-phosphatidyltransferase [Sphingomonas sp.]